MLIANIGNQHFGSFERAKDLIKAAHEHGADLIKSYAITPHHNGPLEREFYEMCSFSFEEYCELIEYSRSIGNDLFFELHGKSNETLLLYQNWRSVLASDLNSQNAYVSDYDKDTCFVAIGQELFPPTMLTANIMHSMDKFGAAPDFNRIEILKKIYNRNIGFCDRTIGIDACITANDLYNSIIIEKNLTLEKGVLFKGKMIEETIYSVQPKKFEELSNRLMVFKDDLVLH